MLSLRQINLNFIKQHFRQYAKTARTMAEQQQQHKKMVHQETLRYVNPYARVNVQTDIYLRVIPADVHEYRNGDVFIAQLRGEAVKNCPAELKVSVSDDDKEVNVVIKKLSDEANFLCDLKIPIRSELHINAKNSVRVQGVQSERVHIQATKHIQTADLRATSVNLSSENGNINCSGTLLGKCSEITTQNGHITLAKLQGDKLSCKTASGNISTDCCYVEQSQFESENGCLQLKNVHKKCQVKLNKGGTLAMFGVHANLNVHAKCAHLNLQLSELIGSNTITLDDMQESIINISDQIEENSEISVAASEIHLEPSLVAFSDALSADKKQLKTANVAQNSTKLHICSTGETGVRLGKLSWTDMLRNAMNTK